MIDSRFFEKKEFVTIGRICEVLGIEVPQNCSSAKRITKIETIEKAESTDITFFHNVKYSESLSKTKAFACVVSEEHKHLVPASTLSLVVEEPYLAHAYLLKEFYSTKNLCEQNGVSEKASVSKGAIIEDGCRISEFAVISDGVIIRKGSFIGANTTILHGVEIGEDSYIESNVTIGYATIGKRARIKTGARIGQQGFGFHIGKNGITDVMQIGSVVIGENAQIGSNCTIDRGSINDTKIGNCVRIDDMVHIAHNVEIGDYCVIAAQTGIAGSVKIGSGCVFGGQVGIAGHITIGNKTTAAAQSGIMRNVAEGSKLGGSPAVSIINWHRQTIALQKLVENARRNKTRNGIKSLLRKLFAKKRA
ncbi:MAG: UDP-3-O-(3-hydroxymyristoyl)glucosamine N-acyltransferase [Holosporales bacterium]|jgi:UDP-3-O-[3-hydroxymyristoyl] glucosamine N-acyltransferase|nr:UDP-3-O-(3-hydroxymyristoyl)glucosamine N-acyltransferase [Holosporales bacterium]